MRISRSRLGVLRTKMRGGKRYYRILRSKAQHFQLALGPDDWYDYWHSHFDWHGRGDISGRQRQEHLAAMFIALDKARKQLRGCGRPIQVWLSVVPSESAADALYVHTPNPNGENFPYGFQEYAFDSSVPPLLGSHIGGTDLAVGRSTYGGTESLIVVPPESFLKA